MKITTNQLDILMGASILFLFILVDLFIMKIL